jgi:hypothetical protein
MLDPNKRVFLFLCIIVGLMIPDVMINYVAEYLVPQITSLLGIVLFVAIVAVCAISRYPLLQHIKQRSKETISKDFSLKLIQNTVLIVQYSLIALTALITLQILVFSNYSTYLLTATALTSEVTAVVLLAIFSYKFFSWISLNKQSIVVLLYGLSFALASFSFAVLSIDDFSLLSQKGPERTPQSEVVFPNTYVEPGSFSDMLWNIYTYADTISFSLLIPATALLLHHYSERVGKIKFWIIVTLPLIYFLISKIENFGLYSPMTDSEWFNWLLFISLNSTAGGILFGTAFWTIAKTLRQESAVRDYVVFAAYGFVLLFISNQVTPVTAPYPPFGIVSMTFLPLSAYLLFLGVYSTAVSISQDNQLRKSVRKFARENVNLLSSIGTAQMEQEIQRTVKSMKDVVAEQEKGLQEQTGIEANLEEDEMKKYLEEVMQEVGKSKKPT